MHVARQLDHFDESFIRRDSAEEQSGALKPLKLRDGGEERTGQFYLVYADAENAGPGTKRLAEIIREMVKAECASAGAGTTS